MRYSLTIAIIINVPTTNSNAAGANDDPVARHQVRYREGNQHQEGKDDDGRIFTGGAAVHQVFMVG